MKIISKILVLFCMTLQMTIGAEISDLNKIPEDYKHTFMLPISSTDLSESNLIVELPEGYVNVQPLADFGDKGSVLIEFIKKGEDVNDWSEIITISKYIGKKVPANALIKYMKEYMLKDVNNGKTWKEDYYDKKTYQYAILGLTYDLKGKHEIFQAQYYSGPYDCVGVQYTIRPKKGETDASAINKIGSFFKDNVKVYEENKAK